MLYQNITDEMVWKFLYSFLLFLWISSSFAKKEITKDFVTNLPCFPTQFRCDNGNCIKKNYRCDGDYTDCGQLGVNSDRSDEYNCSRELWQLNRFERYERVKNKAAEWIIGQIALKPDRRSWGYSPDRVAVALYFLNETYFYHGNSTGNTVSYELQNYVLSKLAQQSADEIDLIELASFINALTAACIEPREFYGVDLVAKLRARVDHTQEISPLPFIALCNAGIRITRSDDIQKLLKVFNLTSRPLWAGMQAMALMGLSCGANFIAQYSDELRKAVNSTTSLVEDMKTTALVLQALIATNDIGQSPSFDVLQQFNYISLSQEKDGSYGDMLKTYYILPIFSWKSLVDIKDTHCTEQTRKERIIEAWNGEKRQVQYSVWLGNSKYLNISINLRAPVNEKFYSIMKVAAVVDERFRFEVSMRGGKPYVYSVFGIEDDPEAGNLWYFYKMKNSATTELLNMSPVDYMPANGDHLVYWFHYNSEV